MRTAFVYHAYLIALGARALLYSYFWLAEIQARTGYLGKTLVSCEIAHCGKGSILTSKFSFWEEDWTIWYNSMKF